MKKPFKSGLLSAIIVFMAAMVSCQTDDIDPEYTITVISDDKGVASADILTAKQGTQVTILAAPHEEYFFTNWTVVSDSVELSDQAANPATFTMPAADVLIRAEFDVNLFSQIVDSRFKRYIWVNWDKNYDGILTQNEANEVSKIILTSELENHTIMPLSGIEVFPNLERLMIDKVNFSLPDFGFSKNPNLTKVELHNIDKPVIDFSNIPKLSLLICSNFEISELNVSNNSKLTTLGCWGNNLSTIDVSKNTALSTLEVNYNNLSLLDVSNNNVLRFLVCNVNNLNSLDIGQNIELEYLNCSRNNISVLDISNNSRLGSLNINENNFSADALRDIFASLPMRDPADYAMLQCAWNPENSQITAEDIKVALDKNWIVEM